MQKAMQGITRPLFWVWISFFLYLFVSIPNLTNYTTADEHFWLPNIGEERVQQYWRALFSGDWEGTRINDKPGITLAYLSGLAIPFTDHLYDKQRFSDSDGVIVRYDPEITKVMHFAYRFPIVLFTGLFVFYFFHILSKITKNKKIAALSALFLLFSPVLVGISHIVNPDSLFWIFGTATILTYIYILQKRNHAKYIFLSAIFFGLSLASKYVGIILIPFFLVLMIVRYVFYLTKNVENNSTDKKISSSLQVDIRNFALVIVGGFLLFALMMPAAIADPEVFYESTIGFPGMPPIFVSILVFCSLLLLDVYAWKSKIFLVVTTFFSKHIVFIERVVYGILITCSLFVFFNWISKNSIIDLSHIPFYAKTKASFTDNNPYWVRFVMEFVPLVFALTPLTFFFLILYWIEGFFQSARYRFFGLSLSLFFLVFFAAVVEQGLLVTVRYNIILYPLAIILASMACISLIYPPKKAKVASSHFLIFLLSFSLFSIITNEFVNFHSSQETLEKGKFEYIVGMYGKYIFSTLGIVIVGLLYFLKNKLHKKSWLRTLRKYVWTFPFCMTLCLLFSGYSLFKVHPHFFLYTNHFLPNRYILNHPWGYGGYEAAQYLNALPDAQNLTLWTNTHGVCEFFVGNCIRRSKLDIEKYRVDYLFFAHMGSLQAKFETDSKTVWTYYPDGRKINFVKISKNDPEAALEELRIKEYIRNFTPSDQEK